MQNPSYFPVDCLTCSSYNKADFEYYNASQTWILLDAEKQIIHIHYGVPVKYEEKNTEEAHWVYNTVMSFFQKHPELTFFSVVDFSQSDDSEFVSLDALQLYKKLMTHPQNGFVAFCGVGDGAIASIISGLLLVTGQRKRTKVLFSCADAETEYKKWYNTQRI